MARTKFSELRKQVEERPGARERLAAKRDETLEEIRLYELRHAAGGQPGGAGRPARGDPRSDLEARARGGCPDLDVAPVPRGTGGPTRACRRVRG